MTTALGLRHVGATLALAGLVAVAICRFTPVSWFPWDVAASAGLTSLGFLLMHLGLRSRNPERPTDE